MTDQSQSPLAASGSGYNKLAAGSTASLVGGALTTVVIALVNGLDPGYHMTDALQGAIQTLVTLAVTAGAIYLVPHGSD